MDSDYEQISLGTRKEYPLTHIGKLTFQLIHQSLVSLINLSGPQKAFRDLRFLNFQVEELGQGGLISEGLVWDVIIAGLSTVVKH